MPQTVLLHQHGERGPFYRIVQRPLRTHPERFFDVELQYRDAMGEIAWAHQFCIHGSMTSMASGSSSVRKPLAEALTHDLVVYIWKAAREARGLL